MQPLTGEQLSRIVPLKPNQTGSISDVRQTIKSLFATGRYSYVEVDSEPAANGVSLVIRTRPRWFVGPVEVDGDIKLPPSAGQLANATRLELGTPYTEDDLKSAVERMEDLLHRNGFFQAKVVSGLTREDKYQQVSFRFLVDTGKRARLMLPRITGDTRLPPDKLAKAAKYKGWFRWKPATADTVRSGVNKIRSKYEDDDRLTATVRLRDEKYDAATNRVQPVIEANGGDKIEIRPVGAKISDRKLKKYVPVFDEQAVDRDLLVEGASNLRDYFESKGYFEAEVDFETRRPAPDHEEILYVVTPGTRHKLVEVTVRGNKYFSTEDIRSRMFLQPAGFLRLRHGRYSQGFVRRDEKAITNLYHSNGFRDVKVSTQTINDYQGKAGDVAAVVTIVEGPQYRVSDLQVTGVKTLDINRIAPMLATVKGQPFSETNVGLDRDYVIGQYQSAGYPDVAFDWRMEPGPGPQELSVHYVINEGEKRYVRDVLLTGMRTTRHRLVDPNILLHSGDALSWTEMGRMQRRLYNLGVFDKVNMAVQNPEGDTQNKYVLYHLEEGHRYSMAAGFGAEVARIGGSQDTLNNPAGATGFSPRVSLDLSRLNLWGLGHSLNFKSRYSSLDRRVLLNYSAPRYRNVDGRNISLTASYDNTRDVRTFTARKLEGSAQISKKFSKATLGFLRYSYRDSRVDQNTIKINPLLVPLAAQTALVGMLSGILIQDRRDDPSDAHRGWYNTADFGVAPRAFGSRNQFAKFLGRSSYYKALHGDYVLASNTQFGWLGPFGLGAGVDPEQSIPLPERFFGGGSTSHRGFPDNQAGPRDTLTGFPLGGNALLFHSTELRFPFIGDNIDGVFFHDMGNVYSSPSKISFRVHQRNTEDFNYMVHAAGFGIRYRTPVGPIRVDLAYSINPPRFYGFKGTFQELLFNTGTRELQRINRFQFFFSIGQAF